MIAEAPRPTATLGAQRVTPYIPGRSPEQMSRLLGIDRFVALASNENPLGCAPAVLEAISRRFGAVSRYPDSHGRVLKERLAELHGVDESRVCLGNGSNELLNLCALAYTEPGREIIYSQYAFHVFRVVADVVGAVGVCVPARDWGHDLEAMAARVSSETACIYIANPNNPTGTWIGREVMREFLDAVPRRVLVVIDEAYCQYVDDDAYPDCSHWIDEYPNLVVTRTFSKAYGLAALRVGYALADARICQMLERVRDPFNVNDLGHHAARAALDAPDHIRASQEMNRVGRVTLLDALEGLGYPCLPAGGNFVTMDCGAPSAPLFDALLRKGIIVRTLEEYDMPHHLRVTIGAPAEIDLLLDALRQLAGAGGPC